jgi:hypothetical protein
MKKLFLLAALMVSGNAMANCCHQTGTEMYHDFGHRMCPSGWWTASSSNCDAYAKKASIAKEKMEVEVGS